MIDGSRIDVFPKKGNEVEPLYVLGYADPVYVMLNHTNRVTDATTLAHEIGHAIHGTPHQKRIRN